MNADLDYTLWSTFDRIVVTSDNPAFNATDEKQWHDVWCFRIGGQYKLSDQWKLRAGYVYDKSPVGENYFDTRTPDADRQGITIGTGYATGNMTVDLAYMYLRFNKRTIIQQPCGRRPESIHSRQLVERHLQVAGPARRDHDRI